MVDILIVNGAPVRGAIRLRKELYDRHNYDGGNGRGGCNRLGSGFDRRGHPWGRDQGNIGLLEMNQLQQLMAHYAGQGRTLDSILHLCGRKRRTLVKHARQANIQFPDLRNPNKEKGE